MKQRVGILVATAVLGFSMVALAQEKPPAQRTFDSPRAAADAFVAACEANDTQALIDLFGPGYAAESERIDDSEQRANRASISDMARQILRIEERGEGVRVALLGSELWPFPVPIVLDGARWRFDTEAGLDELLKRRIGRNELIAIDVCRAYVEAQIEYAAADRDGDGTLEFAQQILSTSGKQDGLYWEVKPNSGDELSPFGPLLADADPKAIKSGQSQGYMGYHFRVITNQGKHAPGGKRAYIDGKNMTAGFALCAWPVDYLHSGVMTFMVNHLGAVYQKDLGVKTRNAAERIKRFDPDTSWVLVANGP